MHLLDRQQRRVKFEEIDIYPVIGGRSTGGRSCRIVLRAVLDGGARIVQLREKGFNDSELYETARLFRQMTHEYQALFILNDRLDIALATDADGVHLGQNDLPLAAVRRLAPEILIGVSTHSLAEALDAEKKGADYFNIGPIFTTRTKPGMLPADAGLIREISACIRIPFTVMGGITLSNVEQVLSQGARKIAVITALTLADNVKAATSGFIEQIRAERQSLALSSHPHPRFTRYAPKAGPSGSAAVLCG